MRSSFRSRRTHVIKHKRISSGWKDRSIIPPRSRCRPISAARAAFSAVRLCLLRHSSRASPGTPGERTPSLHRRRVRPSPVEPSHARSGRGRRMGRYWAYLSSLASIDWVVLVAVSSPSHLQGSTRQIPCRGRRHEGRFGDGVTGGITAALRNPHVRCEVVCDE